MIVILLSVFYSCKKENTSFVGSGHPAWAPIMYQDGNSIVGVGPDIVKKIFDELGLNISIEYTGTWDVVQEKARSGEVDLLVAAYKTAERETYMDYSVPYTVDPVSIFVKNGHSFPFNYWDELIGKRGVVTKGDSYGQAFDLFIKSKLTVTEVTTPDEAFNLLTNGDADYFVYAYYSGENYLAKNNLKEEIEVLPNNVSSENFYFTISKKSALVKYLPEINKILERYIADGTIKKAFEKYK